MNSASFNIDTGRPFGRPVLGFGRPVYLSLGTGRPGERRGRLGSAYCFHDGCFEIVREPAERKPEGTYNSASFKEN